MFNKVYNEDCLTLMQRLPAESVNLIYIDPPFGFARDKAFGMPAWKDNYQPANRVDIILPILPENTGIRNYLRFMHERLKLMHDLLHREGSIYVHCDWRVNSYLRLILDEIFGYDNFRNMIVWHYGGRGAKAISGQFPRNYDILLVFSKSSAHDTSKVYREFKVPVGKAPKFGFKKDATGRWFKTAPRGDYTDESVARLEKEGRIYRTIRGNIRIKYFLEEQSGFVIEKKMVGDVWDDISDMMHTPKNERLDFPTQKPEALLKRVILASSNSGDLVADFFCGSGTTCVVAEKLGRKWVGCDTSEEACQLTRERMNLILQDC